VITKVARIMYVLARRILRPLYRRYTIPIHAVIKAIRERNLLADLYALEVFGRDGDWLTKVYAPYTKRLQIWEVDPAWADSLRNRFPDATIKIVDSFAEIRITKDKFNFVVIDSPMSTYGSYCEHFDLFPHVFRVLLPESILLLTVIPNTNRFARKRWPYLFNHEQLRRRAAFYGTQIPEDVSISQMIEVYGSMARENGYQVSWTYSKKRGLSSAYFLALYLKEHVHADWASLNMHSAHAI
jgi:hypothetical protein